MTTKGTKYTKENLDRLPDRVHIFDVWPESFRYQISFQLAVGCQQTIFNCKGFRDDPEGAHLLVVRQAVIHCVQCGLHLIGGDISCNDGRKITATVPHQHDLLRRGKARDDFLLDWFRGDVMSGIEDDEILDSSDDLPVSVGVHLALVASVEPAVS